MPGPNFYISNLIMQSLEIKSGQSVTGTIVLESAASGDGTVLITTDTSGADVPATVAVSTGNTSATFTLSTSNLRVNTVIKISVHYYGQVLTTEIRIIPANIGGMYFDSGTVVGGNTVDLTIELDSADNVGGVLVDLTQESPLGNYSPLFTDLPETVSITAGNTSVTITLTTREVSRNLFAGVTADYLNQQATASILVTTS